MRNLPRIIVAYPGASTLINQDGIAIAECVTPEIAEALQNVLHQVQWFCNVYERSAINSPYAPDDVFPGAMIGALRSLEQEVTS